MPGRQPVHPEFCLIPKCRARGCTCRYQYKCVLMDPGAHHWHTPIRILLTYNCHTQWCMRYPQKKKKMHALDLFFEGHMVQIYWFMYKLQRSSTWRLCLESLRCTEPASQLWRHQKRVPKRTSPNHSNMMSQISFMTSQTSFIATPLRATMPGRITSVDRQSRDSVNRSGTYINNSKQSETRISNNHSASTIQSPPTAGQNVTQTPPWCQIWSRGSVPAEWW